MNMKHKILLFYSWIIRLLTSLLPESRFSSSIRGFFYSIAIKKCGKNFQVSSGVILQNLENLEIGNDVYFAPRVIINAAGNVKFEDEVMLGFNVVIVSTDHTKIDNSFRFGESNIGEITLKKGCWIGANSVVLRNTTIEEGVVVGANSVIKGVTVPNSIYVGCPAKIKLKTA